MRGFTLIELLVVITIIVVLISLLAPAMDKAIYAAELTVCAAQMNGVGVMTTTYAIDHKRWYPYRPGVEGSSGILQYELQQDRQILNSYMSVNKFLNCPFTVDSDFMAPLDISRIFADYDIWFGWHFTERGSSTRRKGMKKIGDSFEAMVWRDDQRVKKFNVMLSDHWFMDMQGSRLYEVAHPDRQGMASQEIIEGAGLLGDLPVTGSGAHWSLRNHNLNRQEFDLNYLINDGSVRMLDQIIAPWVSEGQNRVDYVFNQRDEGGSFTLLPLGN